MNPVCSDLTSDSSPSAPLLPSEFGQQLVSLQAMLANLQTQIGYAIRQPLTSPTSPTSGYDQLYLIRTTQNNVATIAEIRSEVSAIKAKLQHLTTPATLCTGPMALATCLLAISLLAISIIVLSSLGLAGILPQVSSLLVSTANAVWTIVSASIVTVICLISVLCVTLIRHHKPIIAE
ncbi:hypothetical protein BOKEGFJH_00288 [Chlamydia avium]|uniref:Inclusion membrane protein C n=1 Tax=Chlamydia avium TaxID=1457141 RepID=A0ABN0MS53_9CHLA|nr:hypothetical protein [Chlamydia avium]EPP35861.1 putative inclusion membrane protein C [Chlamydia psittaci 10_743_SC13]EPP38270.1 putative inclusion membrane protein C [Chlamydia avium]VVT42776.1 hypothetical protein BOKEGFJH_00288 [Chlamydia avium]